MRRRFSAAALMAAVVVTLLAGRAEAAGKAHPVRPPTAATQDPWVGPDKALHLCASAALATGGYGLGALITDRPAGRLAFGAALSFGAGAGKEALDVAGLGTPSLRDLLWDVVGTAFGLALAASLDVTARPAAFR